MASGSGYSERNRPHQVGGGGSYADTSAIMNPLVFIAENSGDDPS